MTRLKIKTESLPQRCDICHQIDEFDPETGVCSRCADLPAEKLIQPVERLNLLQRAFMRADFLAALSRIRMRAFFDGQKQENGFMRFAFFAFITLSMGLIIGLAMTVLLVIFNMPTASVKSVQKNERLLADDEDYRFTDQQSGAGSARSGDAAKLPSVEYHSDLKGIFSGEPSDLKRASDDERK